MALAERIGAERPATLPGATFVPFSAYTRMSGIDFNGTMIRKGAPDSVTAWVREQGGESESELATEVERIARSGGTPLLLAREQTDCRRDPSQRYPETQYARAFRRLRAMGIRTIMITGDNPLTAAAIAKEAGVDDFLAEATPETKMDLIKREQSAGRLVAMTGDGTNDAPALAQADVGVAMNSGTQAAKEAANMIDLDSDPTKLIEVVEIGKQLLMTRGALTTFSIANDVAKYFAILPAMFAAAYPAMNALECHALDDAAERDTLGDYLQRAHHRRADPAGAARREIQAARRKCRAARKRPDLRRRRHYRTVRRHQTDRLNSSGFTG